MATTLVVLVGHLHAGGRLDRHDLLDLDGPEPRVWALRRGFDGLLSRALQLVVPAQVLLGLS